MCRKNLIKVLVLVLAMVMLLSTTAFSIDRYEQMPHDYGIVFIDDLLVDAEFTDYLTYQLHAEFGEQFMHNHDIAVMTVDFIYDAFPVSRSGETMYPDSFGGMYIDDDGNLVILMVEYCQFNRVRAYEYAINVEYAIAGNASTRVVEFSYIELKSVFQVVADFIFANWSDYSCPLVYNLVSVGVSAKDNSVRVSLLDTSPHQIDLFKAAIIDHPAIDFIQIDGRREFFDEDVHDLYYDAYSSDSAELIQPFNTVVVHPGTTIRRHQGSVVGSIGFRARLGSLNGFVTAAHSVTNINQVFLSTGREIGQVRARHTLSDSAFVSFSPGVSMSNRNPSANAFPVTQAALAQANFVQGRVVSRVSEGGREDSGDARHPITSTGRIDGTGEQLDNHGFGPMLAFRANYLATNGDSGGIILAHGYGSDFRIAGIHVGNRRVQQGQDPISYFSSVNRITSGLGISLN